MSKLSLVPPELKHTHTAELLSPYRQADSSEIDEAAIVAAAHERVRLADYTSAEVATIKDIYPPDQAAYLLRPRYTLREQLANLPRGWLFLAAGCATVLVAVVALLLVPKGAAGAPAGQETTEEGFGAVSRLTASDLAAGGPDAAVPGSAGAAASAAGKQAAGGAQVFVHVVGQVHKPGVYALDAGSRVTDALEKAGGATDKAVLEGLNLAAKVTDGAQILVPDAQQAQQLMGAAAGPGAPHSAGAKQLINLNTATLEQLKTLPKIGDVAARKIIAYREQHGGFRSVDELLQVSGIGAKTLEGFRDRVTV